MKRIFVSLLFLLLVLAFAVVGPDAPAEDPSQAAEEPETSEPPAGEPPADEEVSEEPPETFVPSEKLPADSAISFPVDI